MGRVLGWLGVLLWLASAPLMAREVAGVTVPEGATLSDGEQLMLNGAGIRTKFFFKIYVGALYLPARVDTPEAVYAAPGGRRVLMHFLYSEIAAKKLVDAWNEGFEANLAEADFARLKPRIDAFDGLFHDVKAGDEMHLDYIPGKGTEVWSGDTLVGTIEGADFQEALMRIWLGKKPADKDLKVGMLGR